MPDSAEAAGDRVQELFAQFQWVKCLDVWDSVNL